MNRHGRSANLVNLGLKNSSKFQRRSRESIETVRMSAEKSLRSISGAKVKSKISKKLSFGRRESIDLQNTVSQNSVEPVQLTKTVSTISEDMFKDFEDQDFSANDSLLTRFKAADQVPPLFATPSPVDGIVSPQPGPSKALETTPIPSSYAPVSVSSSNQTESLDSSPLPPSEIGLTVTPESVLQHQNVMEVTTPTTTSKPMQVLFSNFGSMENIDLHVNEEEKEAPSPAP